jgi:hypothetical protein
LITEIAAEKGIQTPLLNRLVELIHDVERGERPIGSETFKPLVDLCQET